MINLSNGLISTQIFLGYKAVGKSLYIQIGYRLHVYNVNSLIILSHCFCAIVINYTRGFPIGNQKLYQILYAKMTAIEEVVFWFTTFPYGIGFWLSCQRWQRRFMGHKICLLYASFNSVSSPSIKSKPTTVLGTAAKKLHVGQRSAVASLHLLCL